jgi:enoyl-CoA hydratase
VMNYDLLVDEADEWERSDAAHWRLMESEDVKEGIEAFFQRRPPRWSGR